MSHKYTSALLHSAPALHVGGPVSMCDGALILYAFLEEALDHMFPQSPPFIA